MSKTSHIIHVLPKMPRITRFSCKIETFGNLTCVKHHTNSLPVNSPMQCIMVSPNLILGCQPQLSETRLAKGQLVLDKAPRPSISNVIWIFLSATVSSTNYFQIVRRQCIKYLRIPNPKNLDIRAFTLLRIFDPEI